MRQIINHIRKFVGLPPKYILKTASYKKFQNTQILIEPAEKSVSHMVIVTKPHTNFFAHLLAYKFLEYNVSCLISPYDVEVKNLNHKIIFCPQNQDNLDDGYLGYQTEQSSNDRFFTEAHIAKLNRAKTLIDYAQENIEFLKNKLNNGIQYWHLPMTYLPHYQSYLNHQNILLPHSKDNDNRPDDVVFYGDPRNARRQAYLKALQKHFNVKIICGEFGADVMASLLKAKIIVNIHYFDNAILEIGRIYEALSLGCHVVSERAIDQDRHQCLNGIVDFCDIDDISDMVEKVRVALSSQSHRDHAKKMLEDAKLSKSLDNNFDEFIKSIGVLN